MNGLLAAELTAMDQYFIHSRMYADWGFEKLRERLAHEFEDLLADLVPLVDPVFQIGAKVGAHEDHGLIQLQLVGDLFFC